MHIPKTKNIVSMYASRLAHVSRNFACSDMEIIVIEKQSELFVTEKNVENLDQFEFIKLVLLRYRFSLCRIISRAQLFCPAYSPEIFTPLHLVQ